MEYVTPKIYHLASPSIDRGGLQAFLNAIGVSDWRTNAPSDQEELIEIMGRLCYRSFAIGLNPNITRIREGNEIYLANIENSGHGSVIEHGMETYAIHNCSRVFCFTPDTEILTKDGWKNITKLLINDLLLTKNPATGLDSWNKANKLHKFNYSGKLHWFQSSQWISPAFTPDHIQWGAKYDIRKFRNKSLKEIIKHAQKITFSDLNHKRFVIDHKISLSNYNDPKTIIVGNREFNAETFFLFLGIWVTDGCIAKDKNAINITQIKPSNKNKIIQIMTELFGNDFRNYDPIFRISDVALKNWLIKTFLGRTKNEIRLINLFNYSPRLLSKFYEGSLLGDGNKHKNGHEVIYCSFEEQAKDYQTIIAMIGKSSNIRIDDRRGKKHLVNGQPVINKLINYIISVHKNGESLIKKSHYKNINYTGPVFCPETKDGLVFVRKQGMAFWCGNTHELVRHRLGTAFSQESMRYVRIDELKFWFPKAFADHPQVDLLKQLSDEALRYLEKLQRDFAIILDLDNIKSFDYKKKLTSAMRRWAPDGLATAIGLSINPRAARWIVQMRTASHAEEEIRLIFGLIYNDLKVRYPNLYQDSFEEVVDGFPEVTFKNRKI